MSVWDKCFNSTVNTFSLEKALQCQYSIFLKVFLFLCVWMFYIMHTKPETCIQLLEAAGYADNSGAQRAVKPKVTRSQVCGGVLGSLWDCAVCWVPPFSKALSLYLNKEGKETGSLPTAELSGLREATKPSLWVRTVPVVCPAHQKALKFLKKIYNHPSSHFPMPQTKTLKNSCAQFFFTWECSLTSEIE